MSNNKKINEEDILFDNQESPPCLDDELLAEKELSHHFTEKWKREVDDFIKSNSEK